MNIRIITIFLVLLFTLLNHTFAQSVIDDISENSSTSNVLTELVTERVIKKSPSKRVFIISNSNESFSKGDFISIILSNKIVFRALVAKSVNDIGGIKILKIHSLNVFKSLKEGDEIQVLRGDDSYFNRPKQEETDENESQIQDEDDLYNESTMLDDDLAFEDNKNRVLKTDNIVSLNMSFISGLDTTYATKTYTQYMGSWAYQLNDNIWGELSYAQSVENDFPASGLDTTVKNVIVRLKYTITAPFNFYLQPYIGYQMQSSDSPGAGVDSTGNLEDSDLQNEINLVEELKKNSPVFGATALKRLVPGWFLRADVGSDIYGIGLSLEF